MKNIAFNNLWEDDDGMLKVEMTASNGIITGQQDFYAYPNEIEELGAKLSEFPSSKTDEVIFEYGNEENYYSYVFLKAQVLKSSLRSVLEIKFDNRLEPPKAAQVNFYIPLEPTELNRLGKSLVSWSKNPSEALLAKFNT